MLAVWLLSRSEIHGNAVLYDFVLLKDLIQDVQRPSAIDHEILRDDLKPVDNRFARENMVVVGSTQADSYTVICKPIKAISRHSCFVPFPKDRGPGGFSQPSYRIVAFVGLLGGWLGAIGLAAALALAGVLAFTSVLFLDLLVVFLVLVLAQCAERGLQRWEQS